MVKRQQMLGTGAAWFYFGHSGYEYIDLGRLWQIALLAGLFLWLALMVRAILPALRQPGDQRPLLVMFLISSAAIAMFYMAALGYGRRTNLAIAEYWRWWVVHLWVEGFFEVMVTFSLLPVGLMQTWASVEHGYWYARSPKFLQTGVIETFRWLRVAGDTIFAAGAVALALFVIGLRTGGSTGRQRFHVGKPGSVAGLSYPCRSCCEPDDCGERGAALERADHAVRMPADVPHALEAMETTRLLLVILREPKRE